MPSIYGNNGKINAKARELATLFAEIPFKANGVVDTLTAANNKGISGACQNLSAGKIYSVCFTEAFNSFVNANGHFYGQHPTAGNFCVVGDAVAGGIAMVTMASAANTDAVKIIVPGGTTYTMTALTNGGTPTSMQWVVGADATADVDSATALANLINGVADGTTCGASTLPAGFSARTVGATVIIMTTIPGCRIVGTVQTKEIIVTDSANTVNVSAPMHPGICIETLVGVTATAPAASDKLRLGIMLQISSG